MREGYNGHYPSGSFAEKPSKGTREKMVRDVGSIEHLFFFFLIIEIAPCVYANEKVSAAREK